MQNVAQNIRAYWFLYDVYLPWCCCEKYANFDGQKCQYYHIGDEHQKYFVHGRLR